ncbi:MAG: efflux RND transporter permease subunit [Spirochaetes bacterium]|nr:efflux RND transporter permease subunit [Spirochaetota bacterium]
MVLSKFSVGRPVTVIIIFSLLVIIALFTVPRLNIDLYPQFSPPVLLVLTTHDGAAPEDVEKNITRLLEGTLSIVSDLRELTSVSSEGRSLITLEFDWRKDMAEAANNVRDRIEFVRRRLPDGVEPPVVFKFDPAAQPIVVLTMEGTRSFAELREIAEDIVQPRVEQIPGVAQTLIRGGLERIVKVEVSKNRLEAFSLTITEIASALAAQNVDVSGGSVEAGTLEYLVRTRGEFNSIEEIANTVIARRAAHPGAPLVPIRLRDVADVTEGFRDMVSTVFINGQPGIYINVRKQSGANSVATADAVIAELDRINRALPAGVNVRVLRDATVLIRDSINQVTTSAIIGGIFAMIVLFIFLRSPKSTFIIGLAIPISLLITMMGMFFAGLTINVLSLAGLTLGVGLVIDSSIVMLENIFRYREKGTQLKPSAILGSKEVGNAVTASVITTVCVFLPVLMFRADLGMMGVMFSDLAFTVIVALMSSLFVALVLVPVLASKYLKLYTRKQKPLKNPFLLRVDNIFENFFVKIENFYRRVLIVVLNKRKTTIFIAFLIFGSSLALLPFVGMEFTPAASEDEVILTVELPTGSTLATTEAVMDRLEQIVLDEVRGFRNIIKTTGVTGGAWGGRIGGSHRGELSIGLPPFREREESAESIRNKLRAHFNQFPGVRFNFRTGGGRGPGRAFPVEILVKSNDLDLMIETANEIRRILEVYVPEVTEPSTDLDSSLPEVNIIFNRERLYEFGLTARAVGNEIRAAIHGVTASIYRSGEHELDIVVILREEDRRSIPDLSTIYVTNSRGDYIPVSSFASMEIGYGPVSISRSEQTRVIRVRGRLERGAALNVVQRQIEEAIQRNLVPNDAVRIEYRGDHGELMQTRMALISIVVIALLLVFGVMASQFESFKDPFIMFLTIPFMVIGVALIHLVLAKPFSLFSIIGIVMLIGIVVSNGIVLVDYINLLVKRGLPLGEACVEAGVKRLRPILMTTLTTVLGLTPLAFFPGESSELVQPIGQTVIGGLTTSAIVTLVFIPVMYYVFNKRKMSKAGRL